MSQINCPNCDKLCSLEKNLNSVYIGHINSHVNVEFISYHCDICLESYTTTELDELNVSEIKKGVRRHKRTNQIRKVFK